MLKFLTPYFLNENKFDLRILFQLGWFFNGQPLPVWKWKKWIHNIRSQYGTLPETHIFAPENGWLGDDRSLLGPGLFSGAPVSFREGNTCFSSDMDVLGHSLKATNAGRSHEAHQFLKAAAGPWVLKQWALSMLAKYGHFGYPSYFSGVYTYMIYMTDSHGQYFLQNKG